jgi:hypothetical protein
MPTGDRPSPRRVQSLVDDLKAAARSTGSSSCGCTTCLQSDEVRVYEKMIGESALKNAASLPPFRGRRLRRAYAPSWPPAAGRSQELRHYDGRFVQGVRPATDGGRQGRAQVAGLMVSRRAT